MGKHRELLLQGKLWPLIILLELGKMTASESRYKLSKDKMLFLNLEFVSKDLSYIAKLQSARKGVIIITNNRNFSNLWEYNWDIP